MEVTGILTQTVENALTSVSQVNLMHLVTCIVPPTQFFGEAGYKSRMHWLALIIYYNIMLKLDP